jgi:hypothetical protein
MQLAFNVFPGCCSCSDGVRYWQSLPSWQPSLCHAGHLDMLSGGRRDCALGEQQAAAAASQLLQQQTIIS